MRRANAHPRVSVAGASTIGSAHLRSDLPCQDASAWEDLPGGGCALVVADGAGSSPHSDEGARTVVRSIIETLTRSFEEPDPPEPEEVEEVLQSAIEEARTAVCEIANGQGQSATHFSTTVQAAIGYPTFITFAQLGDGACVLRRTGSEFYGLVFPPHEGEYAGETCFLPQHPSEARPVDIRTARGPWALVALLTDGVAGVAVHRSALWPVAGFFGPIERVLREYGAEVGTRWITHELEVGATAERVNDDRTLVVALREEPPAP